MTYRSDIILKTIAENPGIHFRGIMRKTGLMNGVLSHNLGNLERKRLIVARRGPRTSRFYSSDIPESDFELIAHLRRPTTRSLLLALLRANKLSFAQLVDSAERSKSTVSQYMSNLVRDGIVTVRVINSRNFYHLTDRKRVGRLLEDLREKS